MGWREAFAEMTPEQQLRFAILADCRDSEGDTPDKVSVYAMGEPREYQLSFIEYSRGAESRVMERSGRNWESLLSLFHRFVPPDKPWTTEQPNLKTVQLIFMAELRGIDLDPIVDAVLMGEERQFLERLTLGR